MMKPLVLMVCFLTLHTLPLRSQEASNDVTRRAVDICTVLAAPQKYDGIDVTVAGLYRVVIHGAVLTGTNCTTTYSSLREAAAYRADSHASSTVKRLLKRDKSQAIAVVVRGKFRVAQQGQCFGGDLCSRYEMELTELISAGTAEPANPTSSESGSSATFAHEANHAQGVSTP